MLEAAQRRLDQLPEAMKVRRRTVELVLGLNIEWPRFLTRRLGNVNTEVSLNLPAYNLMRALHVLSAPRRR